MPDNSTTRRTEASPTFRGGAPVEIIDTDTSSTRKGKRITFTFTSAICLRPWTTFSRLLGGHLEWKIQAEKNGGKSVVNATTKQQHSSANFFFLFKRAFVVFESILVLSAERGRRRKKERKRRREEEGGGTSSSCSFASEKADIYIYIKKKEEKKKETISSYLLYKSIRGSGSSGSMIRGGQDRSRRA